MRHPNASSIEAIPNGQEMGIPPTREHEIHEEIEFMVTTGSKQVPGLLLKGIPLPSSSASPVERWPILAARPDTPAVHPQEALGEGADRVQAGGRNARLQTDRAIRRKE
jgi:hypothetical protein